MCACCWRSCRAVGSSEGGGFASAARNPATMCNAIVSTTGGWGRARFCPRFKVHGAVRFKVQGSRLVEQRHWPTAVGAEKYGGCMLSRPLWPSRLPRSDNVVRSIEVRSGLACSALRFGSTGGGPRSSQQFASVLEGGAEGTKITQAFPPKRYIHSLITKVRASHPVRPVKAHLSRPNLLVGLPILYNLQSQLMDLVRERGRSPSHLHPLLVSCHLLPWREDKKERGHAHAQDEDGASERVFPARPVPRVLHGQARVEIGMNMREPT